MLSVRRAFLSGASVTLQVLLLDDEPDTLEEHEVTEDEGDHHHLDMAKVTLNSVVGFTPSNTMKVRGMVGEQEVVVLIDSGATHNFISTRVVERLGIKIDYGASYGVTLGNGTIECGRDICQGLILTLPETQVHADFLPLPLGSTDLILGMSWLQTLGMMTVNWKLLTMNFVSDGRLVTLNGDPSLCRSLVSLKTMRRLIPQAMGAVWVELRRLEPAANAVVIEVPRTMTAILAEHEDVFNMPQGLPPHRDHIHAIILWEGAPPISVRPYRYP